MEIHTGGLVSTLVISLVSAFAGGLAARSIKLPPLLGYLLAGILIGPAGSGLIPDQKIAAELAEIGVALLLFTVGLHFSFRDLIAVRKIAVWGALIQIATSCVLGFLLARYSFAADLATALTIGFSFSVASTAISSRLLDEHRQFSTLAGRIAVGWLVVQDIAAILAMVVIPFLHNQKSADMASVLSTSGQILFRLSFFVIVMLGVARKYIPRLLEYVARAGSRELFTLAVIVTALGLAYGSAVIFDVSIALGAFFAGMVIGETDLNHHAAAEALSLQQIFSILFFVSVGMLFNPESVMSLGPEIFASWAVIVFGLGFVTFSVLVVLHVPPKAAALVGGVFSQAGEFSFILSQMGYEWGVLSQDNRDLISAVALVSIILNPIVARVFARFGLWAAASKTVLRWLGHGTVFMPEIVQPLKGHAILVGYGRVGRRVAWALSKNKIPFIIIEADRRLMEKLRLSGVPVIFGDASREPVLSAALPEEAKVLIVTTPQNAAAQARQMVVLGKHLNPKMEIIVRVHEEAEGRSMAKLGTSLSVMGEREIAVGLSGYALQQYGIDPNVVLETVNELRQ